MKVGFREENLAGEVPRSQEMAFSSNTKMIMAASKMGRATIGDEAVSLPEGTKILEVEKGAPYYIIDRCTTRRTP